MEPALTLISTLAKLHPFTKQQEIAKDPCANQILPSCKVGANQTRGIYALGPRSRAYTSGRTHHFEFQKTV